MEEDVEKTAATDTFGVVSDYIEKNEYVESLSCPNPVT